MKRHRIELEEIAAFDNLITAAIKAARGKRSRPEVIRFFKNFDENLNRIGQDIRDQNIPYGHFKSFYIRDPKLRLIHAACFEDRIVHHAIMNYVAPILERAISPAAYACLPGKGVHNAVKQVQHNIRRYPWYVKIDIQSYFDSIDHKLLYKILKNKFKNKDFMVLIYNIIENYQTTAGKGLPIGSLTSF